jgi:hypothetical protein
MEGVFIMAQLSMPVTSTLPAVGLCAVTFKDGPSIRILEMEIGCLVAYDRDTWTREQVEGLMQLRVGDFELVEPAKAGV